VLLGLTTALRSDRINPLKARKVKGAWAPKGDTAPAFKLYG